MTRPRRLAALVSHPIQYQAPLFRRIAATPGVELEVLFMSDHGVKPTVDPGFGKTIQFDVPLLDGYRHRFLRNVAPRPAVGRFSGNLHPELARILIEARYDALWVHGYEQATTWIGFATALATRTPVLLRGESTLLYERPGWVRLAKEVVLRGLVKASAGLLYIGEHNRRFYEYYGASAGQLFFAPYSVDNAFFAGRAGAARADGTRARLRASIGARESDCVVLFVGKLVDRKRPLDLVEALAQLGGRAVGAIVGDGEQRAEVEEAIARSGARAKVVGFANQSELPGWYAAADVFALPSTMETWGLVVNEAMACGLPSVVSDHVGCAPDLVTPGGGAICTARNPGSLAAALRPYLDAAHRREASALATGRVARYDVSKTADGVVAALERVGRR